ncbi:unnamed protein product [marine sediment metagenome]|uniref:Uncharacterized protein n=1 Tax=marine sediment metagenome TaxID=412755 RepID=X1EFT7_9ZZZZ
MKEHQRLFLEKAKEIGFSFASIIVNSPKNEAKAIEWLETEEGSIEAARYCLVCGHIPFTKENVALVNGGGSWYIGGDRIPKETHQRFIDIALKSRKNWTLDDCLEEEILEVLEQTLDGIHVKDGRLVDVKVALLSKARLYQTYYTPDMDKELFTE